MTIRNTNPTTTHDATARTSFASKFRDAVADVNYANRRLFEIQTGPIVKGGPGVG